MEDEVAPTAAELGERESPSSVSMKPDATVENRPTTDPLSDPWPDGWNDFPPTNDLRRMPSFERRQHFDRRQALSANRSVEDVEVLYEKWKAAELMIHSAIAERTEEGHRGKPQPRMYDAALREYLEDDEFDVVLYSTGQLNRVRLESGGKRPMADDFLPRDIIVSYDGEPVYRLIQLQGLIKAGQQGVDVPVVVRRGSQLVVVNAPGLHHLGPQTARRMRPIQ
jgi:hypothetical protein